MATLWGGRFTKEATADVKLFNASLPFGQRYYREDIQGSLAHSKMLGAQQIITPEECAAIQEGLLAILDDLDNHRIELSVDKYEDIHSLVEAELIRRIGDAGKKLHTGRSRNDQAATNMKLYCRHQAAEVRALVLNWINALTGQMSRHLETFMPGFTHMQKAQPITLAHHLGAYVEMALRDVARLDDAVRHLNFCPLGAAALAGTTYPLDRDFTARELGFTAPTGNSIDSVSDRDYVCELAFVFAEIMMHLSRFSEEVITWCSDEYHFVELDDAYCTGSSIMPQKKNPDICELIRGKTGRVYGALMSLLTMMKGLPLSYNKDLQEDKEVFFDSLDTVKHCLAITTDLLKTATFNKDAMERSAAGGFINATDVADYLVKHGVPFRDAHTISGQLVLKCIELGCNLCTLPLDEYRKINPLFDDDIYDEISIRTCVLKRETMGSPNPARMAQKLAEYRDWLASQKPQNED